MPDSNDDRNDDATISIRLPWILLGIVSGGSGIFGFTFGDYQATAAPQCNALEVHDVRDEIDYATRDWPRQLQQVYDRLDKLEEK